MIKARRYGAKTDASKKDASRKGTFPYERLATPVPMADGVATVPLLA